MTGRPRNAAPSEGFQGFGSGMMGFFAELAEHQTRDWFTANRPRFDREIRLPMEQLVTSATLALAARDIPLMGIPKTSIFRINRDIRFSKNKIPYKTNASAVLTRTGTKHSQGVLYIHVGLDGAFRHSAFTGQSPKRLPRCAMRLPTRRNGFKRSPRSLRTPASRCRATRLRRACPVATTRPLWATAPIGYA